MCFCIALSALQLSKTIKLRETFCVFPRIGQKWSKKHDKTIAGRRALCECGLVHTDLYVQARRYRFVYKLVRTDLYVQTRVYRLVGRVFYVQTRRYKFVYTDSCVHARM